MSDLRQRISALSPEKIALLENKLRDTAGAIEDAIDPARHRTALPALSFAQQRLWFLDRLQPGSALYNVAAAVRLAMPVHVAALERSVNEIVQRHEALRTTFENLDGNPVQVVAPESQIPLSVIDLRDFPKSIREIEAQRVAAREAQKPFNLSKGPLLRTTLLRLDDGDHALLLTMHHIVSDAWSMGIFFRELSSLYEAFSMGQPSPLKPLPIQYADFAVWQRNYLQGEVLEQHLGYWRHQLDGAPAILELPYDHPRPPVQTYRGAMQVFSVPNGVTKALKGLGQREGATLFMTLLAGFLTLLHRYTGQEDLVIGTPIANRNRAEIEGLIGFFVNSLVLRTRLTGDLTFRDLLARVREVTLGAYAHQDLPFEKLVEELQPERSLSHNPLFQVMFTLQAAGAGAGRSTSGSDTPIAGGTAKFDLTLSMFDTEEEIEGVFEYNTDLFDAASVKRMAKHFETLLQDISTHPEWKLFELVLMTAMEQQQVLVEWNTTASVYPREACVHELFEKQVALKPDAVAVTLGGRELTYAELNARANQFARALRASGTGPETRVAICAERSIEMVTAVLAVLKAGAAYVPLDPSYPKQRLALLLEDPGIATLISHERLLPQLPQYGGQTLCLDQSWDRMAGESPDNLGPTANPDNLAYVIYTSGSTGKPKGVAMPHRPLVNLIWWQMSSQKPGQRADALQFASLNFDVSFQEIFSTWCAGGTLFLISEEERRDPKRIWSVLNETQAQSFFAPFVALNQLAEFASESGPAPSALRQLITAGEQLEISQAIAGLAARVPECTLHNQYGPSETHVVSEYILRGPTSVWPARPPIGRPIANVKLYVLDGYLQLVPVGVPGELYVGGVALARGYLNRPDLTAERFIPDPFSSSPGQRLYRTGDRVRAQADGNLEFLGRLDEQAKVRGYRIEPGEIESLLREHRAVQDAAVIVEGAGPGGKRLTAYVVNRGEEPVCSTELRDFLKERLPEYMVPSALIWLASLPLTTSGKLDRRALAALEMAEATASRQYVAPRNVVEQTLADMWQQILKREHVGVEDNFFELGGHSLSATQVISRIRDAFQVEISLQHIFETPTIARLASVVSERLKVPLTLGSIPRARRSREEQILEDLHDAPIEEIDQMLRELAPEQCEPASPRNGRARDGSIGRIRNERRQTEEILADLDRLSEQDLDSLLSWLLKGRTKETNCNE